MMHRVSYEDFAGVEVTVPLYDIRCEGYLSALPDGMTESARNTWSQIIRIPDVRRVMSERTADAGSRGWSPASVAAISTAVAALLNGNGIVATVAERGRRC